MDTQTDNLASAREQGQAQFDSIREMVEALETAQENARTGGDETYAVESRIHESPLSVEVRSSWHSPSNRMPEYNAPAEYQILLCTGGPACRIVGEFDAYRCPSSARMEVQDWGTPWTHIYPDAGNFDPATGDDFKGAEEIMLAYASCFWFGE